MRIYSDEPSPRRHLGDFIWFAERPTAAKKRNCCSYRADGETSTFIRPSPNMQLVIELTFSFHVQLLQEKFNLLNRRGNSRNASLPSKGETWALLSSTLEHFLNSQGLSSNQKFMFCHIAFSTVCFFFKFVLKCLQAEDASHTEEKQ